LLRYRFGDLAQMQRHLHVIDGRTLFFYRDPKTAFAGGSRIVMEFSFGNSEQVSTLRGAVLARIDSEQGQAGAWLEFPDAKLVKKIDQGEKAITGRHQRRLGCDFLVEIKLGRLPFLGRMVDVSMAGARIVGASGLHAGAQVEVRIMGAEPPLPTLLGRTELVRADPGGDMGMRFVRSDVTARVAASKLYAAVMEFWARAPEASHSPLCCRNGNLLDPPLPHMKART
jgi:hypothetical protein